MQTERGTNASTIKKTPKSLFYYGFLTNFFEALAVDFFGAAYKVIFDKELSSDYIYEQISLCENFFIYFLDTVIVISGMYVQ